ncbi:MAG: hypothetical protein IKA22_13995 [Lentisphaeria bacterium]|nr:hypothetical protein [Lentisphaeria bacterium]
MSIIFTPVPENSKLLLNGMWQVKRYPFDEALAVKPEAADDWETLQQPGKVFYADPEVDANPDPDWNRVTLAHIKDDDGAVMVRRVNIPAEWKEKQIKIRFDAVYPGGIFYANGVKLGEHFSGLTPFEADLTGIAVPGEELTVSVRLYRKHKFVRMDMCRHSLEFAGLAQDAYLFAVENTHLADFHLITELDKNYENGSVAGTLTVKNPVKGMTLDIALENGESCSLELAEGKYEYPVALNIEKPALWNDEYPNLYRVTIRLNGQTYSYNTGFRKLELSENGARLNGNFIKFRGINHLTYHPVYGMYTPKDWLRKCLMLMKKANINAIRTHYTGPSDLSDLCDELGFYLLQEIPIDWGTEYIQDPEWVPPALLRIESVVRRDRHHPSVMVWSVGNENMPPTRETAQAGWNNLKSYEKLCKHLDPGRPTMFPPPGPANAFKGVFELRIGDIADVHYSFELQKKFRETGVIENPNSWEADMVQCTRKEALERGWSGCWFSSEYGIFNSEPDVMHGPYLSVIADEYSDPLSGQNTLEVFHSRLKKEWGNMRHDPTCLGGTYFPWLCSASYVDPDNASWCWGRLGEDCNWGVVTPDLLPKPQFWSLRVLLAPVWFPERVSWKKGDNSIRFEIQNQYNSINLSECTFRTQMEVGGIWMSMVRHFKDIKISAAPGETVMAEIPIWREHVREALDSGSTGYCKITFLDPKGFCVIKTDMLIIPEDMQMTDSSGMPLGPDAILK